MAQKQRNLKLTQDDIQTLEQLINFRVADGMEINDFSLKS